MVIQQQLYTVDDVWELSHRPENDNKHFYLIHGELFWTMPPGGIHGDLAAEITYYLKHFVKRRDLGKVTVETGYHPPDGRHTLLGPDVAFVHKSRAPQPFPKKFVPLMPDLAVEIVSPTESLKAARRKAAVYLRHGATLVWVVLPEEEGVEVCRASVGAEMDIEFVGRDGSLSGEGILPGFELALKLLFPHA